MPRPPLAGILEGQWVNHGRFLTSSKRATLDPHFSIFGRWWKFSSGFWWIIITESKSLA